METYENTLYSHLRVLLCIHWTKISFCGMYYRTTFAVLGAGTPATPFTRARESSRRGITLKKGIYIKTNLVNGKQNVGQSYDVYRRVSKHLTRGIKCSRGLAYCEVKTISPNGYNLTTRRDRMKRFLIFTPLPRKEVLCLDNSSAY